MPVAICGEPRRVQHSIDRGCGRQALAAGAWMGTRPSMAVGVVPRTHAFGAWAVPGSKRRRLVQEEEFRVAPGLHDFATTVFEVKPANDPTLPLMTAHDVAVGVMQHTAVAHDVTAGGGGDEDAPWCHTIPARHGGDGVKQDLAV